MTTGRELYSPESWHIIMQDVTSCNVTQTLASATVIILIRLSYQTIVGYIIVLAEHVTIEI